MTQVKQKTNDENKVTSDHPKLLHPNDLPPSIDTKNGNAFVFVYGSCSKKSMENHKYSVKVINSYPAIIPGYVRYYCGYSRTRQCGTASIRPYNKSQDNGINGVSGWVCEMTQDDLKNKLDRREGAPRVYRRDFTDCNLYLKNGKKIEIKKEDKMVYTYYKTDTKWNKPPSLEYLKLCVENISNDWKLEELIVRDENKPLYIVGKNGKLKKMLVKDQNLVAKNVKN